METRAILNFLEEINSAKNFKELADLINNNFIKYNKALCCWCEMMDIFTNQIEISKLKNTKFCDENLLKRVEDIRQTVLDLYENFEIQDIDEFIITTSQKNTILHPIIFRNNFIGYFGMIGEDDNFYEKNYENIKFIGAFINSKFEILSMLEEKKRSTLERTEFLAKISHEFKTPLNSIMGFTEILSQKINEPEHLNFLNNISQSSIYLMKLIQNILDYSQSEYKPFNLKIEKLRPKIIIENVLQNFEEIRKEKNIIFNYTLSDIILEADMLMLKQVIYNLISNAIKSSKNNSIISIVTYVNDKKEFIFEIQDKGEGMNKEELRKIFNFFSTVELNQSNCQTNIGLALCRKILQAHGGEIFVKSKPHHGSTFWFSVPIEPKLS